MNVILLLVLQGTSPEIQVKDLHPVNKILKINGNVVLQLQNPNQIIMQHKVSLHCKHPSSKCLKYTMKLGSAYELLHLKGNGMLNDDEGAELKMISKDLSSLLRLHTTEIAQTGWRY